jgi:CheY-like chemotaxis protein
MDISVTGSSRVLLASPFVDERTTYAAALRERGYELREVADAASLLAAAEAEPPNLIICEIMLPDEDALTVSRKLRAMPLTSDVPFMIVAGTVRTTVSDTGDGVRKACPAHLVVQQAETLIAFTRSLRDPARQTCADSDQLIAENKRLRDETREAHWRRRV